MNLSDDVVMVPVPRALLADVYQVLAERMQASKVVQPTDIVEIDQTTSDGDDLPHREWSTEDLARLYELASQRDFRVIVLLLDLLSESPERQLSFTELYQAAGLTHGSARRQLAQLSRFMKHDFHRGNWPVAVGRDAEGKATYYLEDRQIPSKWREAKAAAK